MKRWLVFIFIIISDVIFSQTYMIGIEDLVINSSDNDCSVAIGDSYETFVEMLGQPLRTVIFNELPDGSKIFHVFYPNTMFIYSDSAFHYISQQYNQVIAIESTGPGISILSGFSVGDHISDVVSQYGLPTDVIGEDGDQDWQYHVFDAEGKNLNGFYEFYVIFTVDDDGFIIEWYMTAVVHT